jgi:hypothetical protein
VPVSPDTGCNDPGLVTQWDEEIKNNKLLQLVMEALESGHPAHHALIGDSNEYVSPTRAAIELGVTRGYSMSLGRMRLMGRPRPDQQAGMPESDYAEEEEVANG